MPDVACIVAAFLSPIPGWTIKNRIRHGYCSHTGGAVATQVEVVALNALSVSRWVRVRGRGFSSSRPCTSQNTVEGARRGHADADRAWRIRVGGALI
jgi:hypothetical protein